MKEKINKRTTKDSIEYLELQCIVNNRIHDYVAKYHKYPKYIKLPLWIFECLKQTMCEVDLKIDYKTEEFTFFNLKVCETISIEKVEEIEVFYVKENDEALKVIGKRYMLWNIQRQVYALKLKGRTVTEEWLIDILDSLEKMQLVEEDNWDTKKYIESEIEQDMIRESKTLNKRIKEMIK